jgi:hypothetical protein
MVLGEHVSELVGGDAEGDDERQIEEKFQRCGRAVRFVGVASRHRT